MDARAQARDSAMAAMARDDHFLDTSTTDTMTWPEAGSFAWSPYLPIVHTSLEKQDPFDMTPTRFAEDPTTVDPFSQLTSDLFPGHLAPRPADRATRQDSSGSQSSASTDRAAPSRANSQVYGKAAKRKAQNRVA
jgi:hypothetical protein